MVTKLGPGHNNALASPWSNYSTMRKWRRRTKSYTWLPALQLKGHQQSPQLLHTRTSLRSWDPVHVRQTNKCYWYVRGVLTPSSQLASISWSWSWSRSCQPQTWWLPSLSAHRMAEAKVLPPSAKNNRTNVQQQFVLNAKNGQKAKWRVENKPLNNLWNGKEQPATGKGARLAGLRTGVATDSGHAHGTPGSQAGTHMRPRQKLFHQFCVYSNRD